MKAVVVFAVVTAVATVASADPVPPPDMRVDPNDDNYYLFGENNECRCHRLEIKDCECLWEDYPTDGDLAVAYVNFYAEIAKCFGGGPIYLVTCVAKMAIAQAI